MGMWKTRVPLLAAVLVAVALATAAYAELPPGSYERLKADAQEKLKIKILTVEKKTQGERRLDVRFTAEVLESERSRSGLGPGETIQIKSYHWTKGYVGPKNPPLLPLGWIGIAYLNKAEGSGKNRIYTLAAYGDSFEESR